MKKNWFWFLLLFPITVSASGFLEMKGAWTQGGVIIGRTLPGTKIKLNGQLVQVSPNKGRFVFGFGREAPVDNQLEIRWPDGIKELRRIKIKQRRYQTQRIDGLAPEKVNPPLQVMERIQHESDQVAQARNQTTNIPYFSSGFTWPIEGRISGVYGSQRVLNGQPRQPHYGIDIAASMGTPVQAPADGVITLAHPDMYFSGKTLIIDHGYGLSSSFLHLNEIYVEEGQKIKQGDIIATVGTTGRVTGPHLDWRMNWHSHRVDPSTLVPPMKVKGMSIQLTSEEEHKDKK